VAGHLIHMRSLVAPVGGALLTRTLQGEGRHQHGDPRKLLTHTRRGAGHRLIRVPKPRIRTRRRVGGHRLGHLLVHRTPTLLRPRLAAPDQDGEAQRPLGVGQRQSLLTLGPRVRPRRPIMVGPVQDHRHREVGGATRAGVPRHPLSVLRRQRPRLPLVDQAMVQQCTMLRHQLECLPVVLICLRRPQLHTRRMNGLERQHSTWTRTG